MIGVDVGGTFTDLVAIKDGRIETVKVATTTDDPHLAVIDGASRIGSADASIFNHASTHGLNAVITRRLPKIAFLTTEGHIDMLDAGRVWRPVEGLTDAAWRRSFGDAMRPLVPRYLRRGIRQRTLASGEQLIGLDEAQARAELEILKRTDVAGVAICLINSYVNSADENRLAELVVEVLGDVPVSISSTISPLAKEYARASTTVIDVFMKLLYVEYTDRLVEGLGKQGFSGQLNYADGAAQLVPAEVAVTQPHRIVFSGPAAGTVSSAHFGNLIGVDNLLCADVGGTSCDISVITDFRPKVDTTIELEHDLVVNTLSNEVSAIGAGGGSLVTTTPAGDLMVGPGSAGANPGPAAYGLGGTQPTTTDTCLLMGVLDPGQFAGGEITLDPELSRAAFEGLDTVLSLEDRVRYAFNIGVQNVAEGIVNVAVQHGIDARDYSLIAYGSAGPMLLPATLELVRAKEVIIPPHPGLFSALGLVSSDLVYSAHRSAYLPVSPDSAAQINGIYDDLERQVIASVPSERRSSMRIVRTFDARLFGQSWETPFIPLPDGPITAESIETLTSEFHRTYQERTGHQFPYIPVQAVTFRVHAEIPSPKVNYPELPAGTGHVDPVDTTEIRYLQQEPLATNVYRRSDLRRGDVVTGPAIIREDLSTTFLVPQQQATVGVFGELRITRI